MAKSTREYASTFGVIFGLALVSLIFLNQYVENFPLGTKTFLFIAIIGVGFFIGVRLLGYSTAEKQIRFEELAILGAVGYALYWVLKTYNLAPEFSIAIRHTLSTIGL